MADETEKLGIDNILAVIDYLEELGKKIKESLEDGTLSTSEKVAIAFKAIKALGLIKTAKAAFEESKDIDSDEAQELLTRILEIFATVQETVALASLGKDEEPDGPELLG